MDEQAKEPYDAFISYSHKDRTWVWHELLPRLEAAGLRIIIDDRDFEMGVPSLVNIERAVEKSRHTLAVLTPAWLESQWAEFESLLIGVADPAGRRRKLVPLMLAACQPPTRIGLLTHADFTRPPDWPQQFGRLLVQLGAPSLERAPPSKPGARAPSDYVANTRDRLTRGGFTCRMGVQWEGLQFDCIATKSFVFVRGMLLLHEFLVLSDISFQDYSERCFRFASSQVGLLSRDLYCVPIAIVENADAAVVEHLRNHGFFEKAVGRLIGPSVVTFPVIYDRCSDELHCFEGVSAYGMRLLVRKLVPDYLRSPVNLP